MNKLLNIAIAMLVILAVAANRASAQYLDSTPDRPAESAPFEQGDTDSVPLNKDDPTFNLWKTLRGDLGEGREPGPINIQKYPGGWLTPGFRASFVYPSH